MSNQNEEKNKPVLWTCDEDAETLNCDTRDDAIHEFLEGLQVERLSEFPEKITVWGYARKKVNRKKFRGAVLEHAYEHIGEEHDGEDGHEIDEEIENACDFFVDTYIKNFTSWQCEKVSSEEIVVIDWVNKNEPQWIENLK